jgi:ACT domain-containing protein
MLAQGDSVRHALKLLRLGRSTYSKYHHIVWKGFLPNALRNDQETTLKTDEKIEVKKADTDERVKKLARLIDRLYYWENILKRRKRRKRALY